MRPRLIACKRIIAAFAITFAAGCMPEMETAKAPFYSKLIECPPPPDPGRDAIINRLTELRDEARKDVRADFRAEIEAYVAGYPVVGNSDQPLIYTVAGTEGAAWRVEPTRRDWAFAICAWMFTLASNDAASGPAALDAAYWAALEAALAQPEETEHLANVMFHLNVRDEFDAARELAGFALARAPDHPALLNNLSFAYAGDGEYACAITALIDASVHHGGPDTATRERLDELFSLADLEEAGSAWTGGNAIFPVPQNLFQSLGWANVQIAAGEAVDAGQMSAELIAALEASLGDPNERASFEQALIPTGTPLGRATARFNQCLFSGVATSQCDCDLPYAEFVADWDQSALAGYVRRQQAYARTATRIHREAMGKRLRAIEAVTGATAEEKSIAATTWIVQANSNIAEAARNAEDAIIGGMRSTADNWTHLAQTESSCGGFNFPGRPAGEFGPFTPWSLFFGIGSISMNQDGTLSLTLGQGLQLLFEYNIPTGQPGLGAGLGVGVGSLRLGGPKLFSAGAYVMVRPGLNAEAGVKVTADPRLGGVGESVTLFNPKVVFLENTAPNASAIRAGP